MSQRDYPVETRDGINGKYELNCCRGGVIRPMCVLQKLNAPRCLPESCTLNHTDRQTLSGELTQSISPNEASSAFAEEDLSQD